MLTKWNFQIFFRISNQFLQGICISKFFSVNLLKDFTFWHAEVVISCGMSSSKWMRQMAFWQSWNRPKERKSGACCSGLSRLQVAGLWGAKLNNFLTVWVCDVVFVCQQELLVSILSEEKARAEFGVIHTLLLDLFLWVDQIPIPFQAKQDSIDQS